jgi:PAS domain S-box-containing protein
MVEILKSVFKSVDVTKDSLTAAVFVSLLSVWVLVGVFTYLNRFTKRRYFSIWTVAWLFYALWLTLTISLGDWEKSWGMVLRQWCISVSAVFLLWGSMKFLGRRVRQSLLILFLFFLLVWGYIGTKVAEDPRQLRVPVFVLIGLASMVSAWGFGVYRRKRQYMGAGLLSFGFVFWGAYLMAFPFLQGSPGETAAAAGFFISSVLQLFIAVSMIILVLEQMRFASQRRSLQEIRRREKEKLVLQSQVISTEERYRGLFERASEAIMITSADDLRLLEMNQAGERLLSVARKDAGRLSLTAFCQVAATDKPAPETGKHWLDLICSQRPLNLVRKDGRVVATEAFGSPIDFEGRPAYQFFFREITDRSRLEQQLRQAEKLSALGQMISGLAHELNNVMTVIKGFVDVASLRPALPDKAKSDLDKASQECKRAARLVRNFLNVAREQPAQHSMVDINEVVRRVTELRKFEVLVAGLNLAMDLDPALPQTWADLDQIQQVLINLVNNALQALASAPAGRILITTRCLDGRLQVEVGDNGPGVPAHLQQKIFEPFFTTKPIGIGTGLGLSIAHSIMSEHHGRIYYRTSALGGAGFVLEFPIESAPAGTAAARTSLNSGGSQ